MRTAFYFYIGVYFTQAIKGPDPYFDWLLWGIAAVPAYIAFHLWSKERRQP